MLTRTTTEAGATEASDRVAFIATTGLVAGTSTVTLTGPAGTMFPALTCFDYTVENVSTGAAANCLPSVTGAGTHSVTITVNVAASPGDQYLIAVHGVANPATAQTGTLKVATSADPGKVSLADDTTAAQPVGSPAFTRTSSEAGATQVSYRVSFATVGGLTDGFSTVTLTAPAGTVFPAQTCFNYTVENLSTRQSANCLAAVTGAGTNSVVIPVSGNSGPDVAPGDEYAVFVHGIANPTATGAGSLVLSTSSDPSPRTITDSTTAPQAPRAPGFTRTSSEAGATQVSYRVSFATVGGLTDGFSTVTLTAPAGTVFPAQTCFNYTVENLSTRQSANCLAAVTGTGTNSVVIPVSGNSGPDVAPGDEYAVFVHGIANPTTTGAGSLVLSTSSDPSPRTITDSTTAARAVSPGAVTRSSNAPGASGVNYVARVTLAAGLTAEFSTITLAAPAGTVFPAQTCFNYTLEDLSTGNFANCLGAVTGTGTATVTIPVDPSAAPGDQYALFVNGVTNATGGAGIRVSTSSDPRTVLVHYASDGSGAVVGAQLSRTSASAGSVDVTDRVSFVAPSGLVPQTSTITLAAPSGTVFPNDAGCQYTITDITTGVSTAGLDCHVTVHGAGTNTITITDGTSSADGIPVAPGDQVLVTVDGVGNPTAAASGTVQVATSADPSPVSLPDDTAAATAVTALASFRTSDSAGAADVRYQARFVATGGLTPHYSTITLAAPSGTVFPNDGRCQYTIDNLTTGVSTAGLDCAVTLTGAGTDTATIQDGTSSPGGIPVQPGDQVLVTVEGVTNPAAASDGMLAVSTSSDRTAATTADDTTAPTAITSVAFSRASASAGATAVRYQVRFVATSGLSPHYSTITLAAPSGTAFPTDSTCPYSIDDVTTGASTSGIDCAVTLHGAGTDAVTIVDGTSSAGGVPVEPGDQVLVTVDGVSNPGTAADGTVIVSTSSDPVAVSVPDNTGVVTAVTDPALSLSSYAAGATGVTYTVRFTATGGLQPGYSTIALTASPGTTFSTASCDYTVQDLTTAQSGTCLSVSGGGTRAVKIVTGVTVEPGDLVAVTATGVANRSTAGSANVRLSTSADPTVVQLSFHLT